MSSEVFYRRWRPQNLGDVVGQEHVTQTLVNALKKGRVSHAYLFCGPRGTGKTSTSRILAKAVNCLNSDGVTEPCNRCSMCQAISESRCMDVIEIDAASNTGVNDIRSLKEKVAYSPSEGRYKVYIIDEVHMLSTSASNALLKTLEEPPPRVMFILATTESHKLLPTILSRCQRFDFKRLSYTSIVNKLEDICREEGLNMETDALNLVARSATGSLRDAENLLEQIYAYYGNNATIDQVRSLLGNTGHEYAFQLIAHIVNYETPAGLMLINQSADEGVDLKQFSREITFYLRGLLLLKSGCDNPGDFTTEEVARLKGMTNNISPERLLKVVRLFGDIKIENHSTLPLELAFIDATLDIHPQSQPPKAEASEAVTRPVSSKKESSSPVKPSKQISEPVKEVESAPEQTESELQQQAPEKPEAGAEPATAAAPALNNCSEYELLTQNWAQMLENAPDLIKQSSVSAPSPATIRLVSALMRSSAKLVSLEKDMLVLSFKFKIHKDKMENTANKKAASQIVSSYLGRTISIQCIHEPEKNHLVRAAQEKLGARITNVEEK